MIWKLNPLAAAGLAVLLLAGTAMAVSDYVIKDPVQLEGIIYTAKWTCPKPIGHAPPISSCMENRPGGSMTI